jgi:hypothetical protein
MALDLTGFNMILNGIRNELPKLIGFYELAAV